MFIILTPATSEFVQYRVRKLETAIEVKEFLRTYPGDIERVEVYESKPLKIEIGLHY